MKSPVFCFRFAQVIRMLGNGRAECYCYDGVARLGHIRGKMRKKVWVSAGDIVLVGKRDYQDDKASITVVCTLPFTSQFYGMLDFPFLMKGRRVFYLSRPSHLCGPPPLSLAVQIPVKNGMSLN